ncbi:unnamed protein product [Caenorhabditis brenneri]
MDKYGRETEEDGTIDVEILSEGDDEEDLESLLVDESDILQIQLDLVDELQDMIVDCFEEHKEVLESAKKIVEFYNKNKNDVADEFRLFLKSFRRKLASSHQQAKWSVHQFRKTLREVLVLYVEVNNRMKLEEKLVIKQDAFIAHVEKNEKEFIDLKENLKKLQEELIGTVPAPPVLPSTTNMSAESVSEANHIDNPFKPIETEIATHVLYVNKAIDDFKRDAPMCVKLPKLMNKVKEQGVTVAQLALAENPPKTIEDFINTLTPKQRD